MNYTIVNVTAENISEHPQAICYNNPKHPQFHLKVDWLRDRFAEGLRLKLLYPEGEKKAQGYIEYTPGEHAFRAVSAKGYMFIHCLWVYSGTYKNRGIASILVQDCIQDAEQNGMNGVTVLSGDSAFLTKPQVFLKNGFVQTASSQDGLVLLTRKFREAEPPAFMDWQAAAKNYQGLHIVYTKQCPWVARFVNELADFTKQHKFGLTITELRTPADARNAPSLYGTFSLINNGKLLASHYISMTRFANIMKKEHLII